MNTRPAPMARPAARRKSRIAGTLAAAVSLALCMPAAPAWAEESVEEIRVSGILHQGTPGQVVYEAIRPAEWNGTLILDLDFNNWNAARRAWFLEQGYAIGGNQRTQNETAYELKDYVDNLVTTRDLLMEASESVGEDVEPDRTIAWGISRGGFVARMAAQYRPDVFDGAVAGAGGGSGVLGAWLSKIDAVWALQELVNPAAGLAINDLPDIPAGASYGPNYEEDVKFAALAREASGSDAGIARMVLAAAFAQQTDFPRGTEPPADGDFHAQGLMVAEGFGGAYPQFVHKEIEVMAGGPVVWNHGVDYRALLDDSGAKQRVQWWYSHAGLDLEADLDRLAAAPRYGADPAAVAQVEQIGSYTGTGAPVITTTTTGDAVSGPSHDEAYLRTFQASGRADADLRTTLIERPGHGAESFGELIAAFDVLQERLDTGAWPDTAPGHMNARVAELAESATIPADVIGGGGVGKFVSFDRVVPARRTWDFTNWGTYRPALTANLTAGQTINGVQDVVMTAADANPVAYHAQLYRADGTAVPEVKGYAYAPTDHTLTLPAVNWSSLPAGQYSLLFSARYHDDTTTSLKVQLVREADAPVVDKVAAPTFSLRSGLHQAGATVVISSATPGAVIRYTTNGRTPTTTSPQYTGPITLRGVTVLRAAAFLDGVTPSRTTTAAYVILPRGR